MTSRSSAPRKSTAERKSNVKKSAVKTGAGKLPDGKQLFSLDQANAELGKMKLRVIDDAAKGELKVRIDCSFPLSEAAAAHAYIEGRSAFGRVIMLPHPPS